MEPPPPDVRLMNLIEAMEWSKETGKSFTRAGSLFASYVEDYVFRFTGEEILANDWESVDTFIPRLTGGRWGAAE